MTLKKSSLTKFRYKIAFLIVCVTLLFTLPGCSLIQSWLNHAPVANAGQDQVIEVGQMVQLEGDGSYDRDNDPIDYNWSFTQKPSGSNAALSDPTEANPTFVADIEGTYTCKLIVEDSKGKKDSDLVTIVAGHPPSRINDFKAADGEDAKSTLTWTNPSDSDLSEVVVRRRRSSYLREHSDGLEAYKNTSPIPGNQITFTDTGLTNGVEYYYAVFAKDSGGLWNDTVVPGENADTAVPEAPLQPYRVKLSPPLLMLSLTGTTRAEVGIEAWNKQGDKLDLSKHEIRFTSTNPQVASVNDNGIVTAHQTAASLSEIPIISASVDGTWGTNSVVVRVTNSDLLITIINLPGQYVSYFIPREWRSVSFEDVWHTYQVVEATDQAYLLQKELTGVTPFKGAKQLFIGEPGKSDQLVPCGISGNPIRLGLNVNEPFPHNNCIRDPSGYPHWDIILHEMGHNFTLGSVRFNQLYGGMIIYTEGLATLARMYAEHIIASEPDHFDLSSAALESILNYIEFNRNVYLDDLATYEERGSNFAEMNPNILDGIFIRLADEYGWQIFPRFFKIFQPQDERWHILDQADTEAKVHALTICALSVAARDDLRDMFRTWNFPIDNKFYQRVKPEIEDVIR